MKAPAYTGCVAVVLVLLALPAAAKPSETETGRQKLTAKFVIYSSDEDRELASSLLKVLRGKDKVTRFLKASTIEKAIESEADVLVLVMTSRELPRLEKETLAALKKRKV